MSVKSVKTGKAAVIAVQQNVRDLSSYLGSQLTNEELIVLFGGL